MSGRKIYGGKNLYGARIGFLMLDVLTPRMPGDVGNATTWPFPVLYGVVPGATPKRVIHEKGAGLLDAFLETADRLVKEGADGLTTTGGYLSIFQDDLAKHCKVPVAASSLMQIPLVQRTLQPGKRVGVITVNSDHFDEDHLRTAGAALDTPVAGTQGKRELERVLVNGENEMDVELAEQDILDTGRELIEAHPDVGAVVFECHNFAPFSASLSQSLGIPVYSVYSFVCWFHAGVAPRDFGHPSTAPREFRER